jgi:hypothetical protein
MANTITSRTIGGAGDQRIQLSNSYFARPFVPPTGWAQLRLAFRFAFTDLGSGPASTPEFAFGFCSAGTNIYKAATTDHFVGVKSTSSSWVRETGWSRYDNPEVTFQPFKRIVTTDTNGSGTQSMGMPFNITAAHAVIFLDLVKGSPNYTMKLFAPSYSTGAMADVTLATFNAQALLLSPTITQHAQKTDRTLAVDEATNGTLNHVNFLWSRSDFLLEVSEISVLKIA